VLLEVGDIGLWIEDHGKGEPALVLLHAFPLDHHVWKDVRGILAERHRVILLDFRGFGRSQSAPGPYSMDLLAADVAAVLDSLGVERAVVGGASMGGYVALAFLAAYPERVAGLALVDSRATADTEEAKQGREKMMELAKSQGAGAVVEEMVPKFFAPTTERERPELIDWVRRLGEVATVEGIVGALAALRDRPDRTDLLARTKVPVAVVVGEHDAITPPESSRSMAESLPGTELTVVPEAGHLAPMEQPHAVADALERLLSRVK
jgi:3-oxoadipate enol-lactonase